jgi:hypothetical protein
VDYFEEFRNDASKIRVNTLLSWWNRYVSLALLLASVIHYLIPPFTSQVFPQHVASTADSSESYDLLAAQQDEDYD